MKKVLLVAMLLLIAASARSSANRAGHDWRAYTLPHGGALLLEVPVGWTQEIRQKDRNLPPTIVLRPKKGEDFEILVTPLSAQGGQLPTMAELEAGLIQKGSQHLSTARQKSVTLKRLKGQQATGRYFLLTERVPKPSEFPSVIGGNLLTGPLVVAFTVLLHDPEGRSARKAIKVLQSARFQPGLLTALRPVTLSIPRQGWYLGFDAPPLTKRHESDSPDQYIYFASSGRVNLSVHIETPGCNGGALHADFYNCFWPQARRNPRIVQDSVLATNTPRFYKISYETLTSWNDQLIRQRHINFLIAYRGKWTDLHISIVEPTEEDGKLLAAFEESLSYGE